MQEHLDIPSECLVQQIDTDMDCEKMEIHSKQNMIYDYRAE